MTLGRSTSVETRLVENMRGMIDTYNSQVFKWEHRENRGINVDEFVVYDDAKIKLERKT